VRALAEAARRGVRRHRRPEHGRQRERAEDMGAFVAGCDRLRVETGATLVAVHHTGWVEARSRGHTSLPGAVNTEILLTRAEGERQVTLQVKKQKDADEGPPMTFASVPCEDSLVLELVQTDVGLTLPVLTPNEQRCLSAVQAASTVGPAKFGDALGALGAREEQLQQRAKARAGRRLRREGRARLRRDPVRRGGAPRG
jgi:hypothetical protein